MSVAPNSPLTSTNVNTSFMSRNSDTDTSGKINLTNADSDSVTDLQQTINDNQEVDNLSSGSATDGQVPTADGAGAITWEDADGGNPTGTTSNDFAIGDGTNTTNKTVTAANGDANEPQLRYNETSNEWEYSNDGSTYNAIGSSGGSAAKTAYIKNKVAQGTSQSCSSSTSQIVGINTLQGDTSFISLSSNKFTLQSGTYEYDISQTFYGTQEGSLTFYDYTNSTTIENSDTVNVTTSSTTVLRIIGRLVITSSTEYDVRAYTQDGSSTGLGRSNDNNGNNLARSYGTFLQGSFTKIS